MHDDERIDGRELIELDEPGSDVLLLLGLLRRLSGRRIVDRSADDDDA